MANTTSRKRMILASGIITVAVALVASVAYPAFAGSAQTDYVYALNVENWLMTEESTISADLAAASIRVVAVNLNGYAFERIDEETLKQLKAETQLTVTIGPKEDGTRSVGVTGSVKINDVVYTIERGTAVLKTERNVLSIRCDGVGEEGNKITLKLGAVYFWWGGKTYALRSKALLETSEQAMLLLQRGIAKIL